MLTLNSAATLPLLLVLDALLSAATGMAMIIAADLVEPLLNVPAAVMRSAGVLLLPFAGMVFFFSRPLQLTRSRVLLCAQPRLGGSERAGSRDRLDPTDHRRRGIRASPGRARCRSGRASVRGPAQVVRGCHIGRSRMQSSTGERGEERATHRRKGEGSQNVFSGAYAERG